MLFSIILKKMNLKENYLVSVAECAKLNKRMKEKTLFMR